MDMQTTPILFWQYYDSTISLQSFRAGNLSERPVYCNLSKNMIYCYRHFSMIYTLDLL